MRISEALAEGRTRLAHTENAALDASLLLSCVLGVGREKLYLDSAELSPADLSRFREYVERRLSGECTAYITGHKEFYGLDFHVNPAVLVPRPDTETLVEAALSSLSEEKSEDRRVRSEEKEKFAFHSPLSTLHSSLSSPHSSLSTLPSPLFSVLDLCTGSGAVAIALKHEKPELDVWAADISAEALETARINAERLLTGRGTVRFLQGDLYAPLPEDSPKFALITANAPYVASAEIAGLANEVQNEPRIALDGGKDGLDLLRRIIAGAPRRLASGGALLLEADPSQMENLAAILEKHGFGDIRIRKDLAGRDRVLVSNILQTVDGGVNTKEEYLTTKSNKLNRRSSP
jgi:release factor glutamine methyltransferase